MNLKDALGNVFTKSAVSHIITGIVFAAGAWYVYKYYSKEKEESELLKQTSHIVEILTSQHKTDSISRSRADTSNQHAHNHIFYSLNDMVHNQSTMAGILKKITQKIPQSEERRFDDMIKLEPIINKVYEQKKKQVNDHRTLVLKTY